MAALSAALAQIYIFKPVDVGVSGVFLLLFVYACGKVWEFLLPFPKETQHQWLRALLTLLNPRPFGLKEVGLRLGFSHLSVLIWPLACRRYTHGYYRFVWFNSRQ